MNPRRNFDHDTAGVCKTPALLFLGGIAVCRFTGSGFTLPATAPSTEYRHDSALNE